MEDQVIELYQHEDGTWGEVPEHQLTIFFEKEEDMLRYIEEQKKYREHSLAEDPEDLPVGDEYVWCHCKLGRDRQLKWNGATWWDMGCEEYKKTYVLAWRYIKPFNDYSKGGEKQ